MLLRILTLTSRISTIYQASENRNKKDQKFYCNLLEAGQFLKKVSEDDKLYSSFFWWKQFYSNVDPSKKFEKATYILCYKELLMHNVILL